MNMVNDMIDLNDGKWKVYEFPKRFGKKNIHQIAENKLLSAFVNARCKKKLTQKMLAEKADMCWLSVSHIENGRRNPSLKSFLRLVEALGMELKLVPKKSS